MKRPDAGSVIIDNLTIRLPAGWQGDPVYLARKISEQIQLQATDIQSTKNMSLTLQGHYAGTANRTTEQFASQLSRQIKADKGKGVGND